MLPKRASACQHFPEETCVPLRLGVCLMIAMIAVIAKV